MTPGSVLLDKEFQFEDNTTGRKLLIILNDGAVGEYITIKTTSNPRQKTAVYGCHADDYYPNFYLPDGSCCLKGQSWLMLTEFYSFDLNHFLQGKLSQRIQPIGSLPVKILKDLLDCAINCEDIPLAHEQALIDIRNSL